MCRWTIGMLAASAIAVTACGSTSSGATTPRPAAPVNVTVYIDNSAASVSPSSVGAGPVRFIITNQASQAESLAIQASGSSDDKPLANTGPINPQATAQVTVDFSSPGTYSLSTERGAAATASAVRPASIKVGPPRPSSDNQVLQP
jgi:hypothetical protein